MHNILTALRFYAELILRPSQANPHVKRWQAADWKPAGGSAGLSLPHLAGELLHDTHVDPQATRDHIERLHEAAMKGDHTPFDSPGDMLSYQDIAQHFGVSPDHIIEGMTRASEFAPTLLSHLERGARMTPETSFGRATKAAFSRLHIGYADPSGKPGNPSYYNPAQRQLVLSPLGLGVVVAGMDRPFASPEMTVAHEVAHALDHLGQAAAHSISAATPGPERLDMGAGHRFRDLHTQIFKDLSRRPLDGYGQPYDHPLYRDLPHLPHDLSPLHYPLGALSTVRDIQEATAKDDRVGPLARRKLGRLAAEWPSTLTEYAMHHPSGLAVMDRIAGKQEGTMSGRLSRFWGFDFPHQNDPHPGEVQRIHAAYRHVVDHPDEHPTERFILPFSVAAKTLHPETVKSYTGAMNVASLLDDYDRAPPEGRKGALTALLAACPKEPGWGETSLPHPLPRSTPELLRAYLEGAARGRPLPAWTAWLDWRNLYADTHP